VPSSATALPRDPTETPAPSPAPTPTSGPSQLSGGTTARSATATAATATQPTPAPSVSESPSSLESETRLLRDADFELRTGHPDGALALLDRHAALFPHGTLVEERMVERVLVLCALGRGAEAEAEGALFLRERPRSLLADRVRASCATGAR
jgi:RNA polymerase sigma-70 factor (ECF subfamily)